jgi:hypothetical protein
MDFEFRRAAIKFCQRVNYFYQTEGGKNWELYGIHVYRDFWINLRKGMLSIGLSYKDGEKVIEASWRELFSGFYIHHYFSRSLFENKNKKEENYGAYNKK